MKARKTIVDILEQFDLHPSSLDAILNRALDRDKVDHRDRRFIFEIVYGIMRNRLRLDFIIGNFLNDPTYSRNEHLMRLLRLGAYQIVYMDKVPPHAAVNETVDLAKANRHTRNCTGLINAVLRAIITNKAKLPQPGEHLTLVKRLSIEFSHPEWLVQRWLDTFGLAKAKKLLLFNNSKPDIYLRRKRKGGPTRQQFEAELRGVCEPGTGYLNLYHQVIKQVLPESFPMLEEGSCTVQAASSGWVVALLDVQPGDRLLDMCAAPGGKTTLLAELTGERGAVCACDLTAQRMRLITENAQRMELHNIYRLQCDGRFPPFTGQFDKVLLDAPCSATGVMHRHPDARWLKRESDLEGLIKLQRELLDSAARQVVSGGVVVYATCSLERGENEDQIEAFLQRNPEFTLDRLRGAVPETYLDNKGFLCITPFEHKMDGMFAARLVRR
jgi:16S rRNA (cytosine967-C5)-methyltransferase